MRMNLKKAVEVYVSHIDFAAKTFTISSESGISLLTIPLSRLAGKYNSPREGMTIWVIYSKNIDIISKKDMDEYLKQKNNKK